ncbi:7-deoxyloganetin glucosyltransferase-like [Gastrolobium bilobum]|uniref:7-deoxyloganetin glucosyltransferase-like n=1 Tax=Gastrolobium bilobum TaxID=150636 RepID=UPI002AAF4508|nr:7-deoxyloganetin glucosyltransferase-like [Gastrolobium bilobum]
MAFVPEIKKPHALLIPFPIQGHINPFLKLAKLLHSKGFHITFVNSEFNHKRLLRSRGPNALNGLPDFHFETIPDGLPPTNIDATQSIPDLCDSTRNNSFVPFINLISKLNDTKASHDAPPVTCIISDGIMSFTIKASQQFGLPNILFWTHSACGFMSFKECKNLMERGLTPLKDANYLTNGHLDTIIDWIPGMKNITLRDLPGIYRTTDPNDILLDFVVEQVEAASKASAIILPTFDALEPDVLNALSTMFPKLYSVGPLELLLDQTSESRFESIKCNLWKEESECLKWLDSQEPNSVLYVNFGSVIVMSPQQLVEFAWGLANSKKNFLWVIRPDLVKGEASIVPPEIVAEIKDKGLMVGWCPQEEVLKHPSVAGFLTHCGWNSTLESICNGVPLICCPFFNDQILNCRYICGEWAFGMEMNGDNVKRDEVEKLVRELIRGEKGKEMKKKAIEWKKLAEEATNTNGSSFLNLEKLVNEVLLFKN